MADVDLNFLARQIERVLTELRTTRDDIRVLMAKLEMQHARALLATSDDLRREMLEILTRKQQ